jgi:hypothetical protein
MGGEYRRRRWRRRWRWWQAPSSHRLAELAWSLDEVINVATSPSSQSPSIDTFFGSLNPPRSKSDRPTAGFDPARLTRWGGRAWRCLAVCCRPTGGLDARENVPTAHMECTYHQTCRPVKDKLLRNPLKICISEDKLGPPQCGSASEAGPIKFRRVTQGASATDDSASHHGSTAAADRQLHRDAQGRRGAILQGTLPAKGESDQ